jgi:hypothetical protein
MAAFKRQKTSKIKWRRSFLSQAEQKMSLFSKRSKNQAKTQLKHGFYMGEMRTETSHGGAE